MLYLKQNSANIIYSNLLDRLDTELTTPATWSFLVEITNDFTNDTFVCIQILGVSFNPFIPFRFSLMGYYIIEVHDTGASDPLNQQIVMPDLGYFSYKIYYQDSITNIDPKDKTVNLRVVEEGKGFLSDPENESEVQVTEYNEPISNYIYVPN